MARNYIITTKGASIHVDGRTFLFPKSHPNYEAALEAAKLKEWEKIADLIDMTSAVKKVAEVEVSGGTITYQGDEVPQTYVALKAAKLLAAGESITPLALFLEKFARNPSGLSKDEMCAFLDKSNLVLTPTGNFLAYKRVRGDYTDCHTGTIVNKVGLRISMPREKVDPDRMKLCSYGFHVCSKEYLKNFAGERLVLVEVDPADVVSVPADYNDAKMRVCEYLVVDEIVEERIDEWERAGPVQEPKSFWSKLWSVLAA